MLMPMKAVFMFRASVTMHAHRSTSLELLWIEQFPVDELSHGQRQNPIRCPLVRRQLLRNAKYGAAFANVVLEVIVGTWMRRERRIVVSFRVHSTAPACSHLLASCARRVFSLANSSSRSKSSSWGGGSSWSAGGKMDGCSGGNGVSNCNGIGQWC